MLGVRALISGHEEAQEFANIAPTFTCGIDVAPYPAVSPKRLGSMQ
jgi:hypothetical protein